MPALAAQKAHKPACRTVRRKHGQSAHQHFDFFFYLFFLIFPVFTHLIGVFQKHLNIGNLLSPLVVALQKRGIPFIAFLLLVPLPPLEILAAISLSALVTGENLLMNREDIV